MTVRTTAMQTCDRCLKPFNEKHLKAGDEVPVFKQKGLVITGTSGTNKDPEPDFRVLLSFDDMCPDCQKAVDNLIGKIRLEGKKPGKPKARKKRGPKKKAEEQKPPTKEYTEDPPAEAKPPEEKPEEPAESKGETTTEPAPEDKGAPPPKEETKPAEEETPAEASGGNGAGAEVNTEGLVEDPETGDKYDPNTGEVVVRGDDKPKAAAKPPAEAKSDTENKGDHPF